MKYSKENERSKSSSSDALAEKFVNYVLTSGIDEPTGVQLAEASGVSQPTWSRTMSTMEFWSSVLKRWEVLLDMLIRARINAEDKYELKRAARERAVFKKTDISNLPDDSSSVEQNIDNKIINSLSRRELIQEIHFRRPDLSPGFATSLDDRFLRLYLKHR